MKSRALQTFHTINGMMGCVEARLQSLQFQPPAAVPSSSRRCEECGGALALAGPVMGHRGPNKGNKGRARTHESRNPPRTPAANHRSGTAVTDEAEIVDLLTSCGAMSDTDHPASMRPPSNPLARDPYDGTSRRSHPRTDQD